MLKLRKQCVNYSPHSSVGRFLLYTVRRLLFKLMLTILLVESTYNSVNRLIQLYQLLVELNIKYTILSFRLPFPQYPIKG